MIQRQKKLPLRVASEVALQGIRVRLGRSIVTVLGVVLGIAFLMSILTGQVVKRGVAAEEAVRAEVSRLYNFLVAEMGPPQGRTVAILKTGELSREEERLLQRIAADEPAELRYHDDLRELGKEAHALLVLGTGTTRVADIATALSDARYSLACFTRAAQLSEQPNAFTAIVLERPVRAEELELAQEEARKARFRSIWIIVISLLVTVMGITNAMLMSVTERFREIGTMKCLGALSKFIRQLFLIESSLIGVLGAIAGAAGGTVFTIVLYSFNYGPGMILSSINYAVLAGWFLFSSIVGMILAVVAALYPASFASRMLPAHALRSNI